MKIPQAAHYVISLIVLGILLLTGDIQTALAEEIEEEAAAGEETGQAPKALVNAPASRAYYDPETGQLTDKPSQGVTPLSDVPVPPELLNAISTSDQGLEHVPVPRERGGGYTVHLRGRFRSTTVATIGSDGKLTTRRINAAPMASQ